VPLASPPPRTVTRLLHAWSHGDAGAAERLLSLLYGDLKQCARRHLRGERRDHTLQPTALVHEAYLRLVHQDGVTWQNRAQFLGLASVMMRRVLVDHARRHRSDKRGGAWLRVELMDDGGPDPGRPVDFLDLEAALGDLAARDPLQARLVELRVFGGLSHEDAAEVLGVAPAAARREWRIARAWLFRRIRQPAAARP
jgi:RNA polymerase sigma-70 factor, ECF subfamily